MKGLVRSFFEGLLEGVAEFIGETVIEAIAGILGG